MDPWVANVNHMAAQATGLVVTNSAHSAQAQHILSNAVVAQAADKILNLDPEHARAGERVMTGHAAANDAASLAAGIGIGIKMISAGAS